MTTRVRAYSTQVELLGLPDTEVPDLALTGIQMAGRAARVLAMTPPARLRRTRQRHPDGWPAADQP